MNSIDFLWTDMLLYGLVLSRITGFAVTAPFISENYVPSRFRILGSMLVSLILVNHIDNNITNLSIDSFFWNYPLEFGIGAVIGGGINLVFNAVRSAGSQIGQLIGLRFQGGVNVDMDRVGLGELLYIFTGFIIISTGGDKLIINTFVDLYKTVPVGAIRGGIVPMNMVTVLGSTFFNIIMKISIPIIAVMVGFYFIAGIFEHFFSNWDIFSMVFPGAVCVGLWLIAMIIPNMLSGIADIFDGSIEVVKTLF